MSKLTQAMVAGIRPEGKRFELWDSDLKGLHLRVSPTGTKSFSFRYFQDGASTTVTLGHFPDITVDQAKTAAERILATVANGKRPVFMEHGSGTHAPSFRDAADRFLDVYLPRLRPNTAHVYKWITTKILVAQLGDMPINAIDPEHCHAVHDSQSSTPRQANLAIMVLSKILNLAVEWAMRTPGPNPCKLIEKNKEVKRSKILSADELEKIVTAINELGATNSVDESALNAIRLLLLTGIKKTEVLALTWDEVELDTGFLHIKSGRGRRRPLPLSEAARALLGSLSRRSKYVFPSVRDASRPTGSLDDAWKRIKAYSSLDDVWIGDLRMSFGAKLVEHGLDVQSVAQVLGVKDKSTIRKFENLRKAIEVAGKSIPQLR